jgi:hypothetical protein
MARPVSPLHHGREQRLVFLLEPFIDFRGVDSASSWLVRVHRTGYDVVSLEKHALRILLGLSLGRESFGLPCVPQGTNRSDRNEPAIDRLGQVVSTGAKGCICETARALI